jgi:hypothetical protein
MELQDTSTLTPAEFSRLSGLSLGYVYARLWSGRVVGAQKIDGQWHIPEGALEALKQRRELVGEGR